MKTFKQFNEDASHITPKQFDVVPSDLRFIRTPDVIKKENINNEASSSFKYCS
jgi:hypothetical protein